MPKPDVGRYRLHWLEQAGDLRVIRWIDVAGGAAAAREAALGLVALSADGAVRVALQGGGDAVYVFTGRRGLEDWRPGDRLPPKSPNAWSRRVAERQGRLKAAHQVKQQLRSAVADGLLDLDGAARVAAALDLALKPVD